MEQNRFIQRNKKNVLRRDILRILVVIGRFNVKRCPLSLKFRHLFICKSGMVSTNNQQKIYPEKICKPSQSFANLRRRNHSMLCFWLRVRLHVTETKWMKDERISSPDERISVYTWVSFRDETSGISSLDEI